MNRIIKISSILSLAALMAMPFSADAGNKDRAGSAGASQLLINPWARSGGLGNSNMASIRGVESVYLNVAGLAFTNRTDIVFTNSNYLVGTDININSVCFYLKKAEKGLRCYGYFQVLWFYGCCCNMDS